MISKQDSIQTSTKNSEMGASRPSISLRAISSPALPQSKGGRDEIKINDLNMLTPPSSPPRRSGSFGEPKIDYENLEDLRSSIECQRPFVYTDDAIIVCPFDVKHMTDQCGRRVIFGHGAWSTVFKGTCHTTQHFKHGLMTPPSQASIPPLIVAIKSPLRKDAITILRNEAKTLSRLRELDLHEKHVASFHGIIDSESSLIIAAHPLSLEDHVRSCAIVAQSALTTANMMIPVIGSEKIWLDLADKLISTLDWMHREAAIVHGDIKPGNILLRPSIASAMEDDFLFQPLFIDFSSSQRLDSNEVTPNTLSAITKEYTAPELLKVAVLRDPTSCATTESDVFSLAVTLLVAATGDPMVYTGYSTMQRQMLATQGWGVLTNVRSLSTRLPNRGIVSRAIEKAVVKKDLGRIDTSAWKQLVQDLRLETTGGHSKM